MTALCARSLVIAGALLMAAASASVTAGDAGDPAAADLWAEDALTTTYSLNPHLSAFDIDIDVQQGVATLRGRVESEAERDLAAELARGVDGIHEVQNALVVDPSLAPQSAGAAAREGERTFIRKVEDANITARVKSQLVWNKSTGGLAIDVDTRNGLVTLSGNVASATESALAEQIARNTGAVKGVTNNLQVNADAVALDKQLARTTRAAGRQISDAWITTKVKSALLYNRNVDGTDIHVQTRDGVVHLRGELNSAYEREQALAIARSVKGVKEVIPDFTGAL